ncbi:MAG: hypothetical protein IJL87_01605 [Clostridia bacterium]|nr:hypothetical protein [Clostridia bacterium]
MGYSSNNCEYCANYVYDEECDCYVCVVNLDIDEMEQFLSGNTKSCAYFSYGDEYAVVKKQM